MNMMTPNASLVFGDDGTATPYQVYTDQEIYEREQERIYRGKTWSFLALEAELPKEHDFKSTFIGDTPVVVTRTPGGYHAWVNRCIHKGAAVCREHRGNARKFQCVYHQWLYAPNGDLKGVPFQKGAGQTKGMPEDFDKKEHSLPKLRVETYKGLIFATFDHGMESLEEYLGPQMRPYIDRIMCKPTTYLGCLRQYAKSNWKLYFENVKDGYHASLLHLFHNTFNILRVSMSVRSITDERQGMHSVIMTVKDNDDDDGSDYKKNNVASFDENVRLKDPEILRMRQEYDELSTNHIQGIFPSLVLQQIHNTLVCRQILPKGPGEFELIFHFFGYEDDDEELREMRLTQANLVGPAGYVSMEDTEATELVQTAIEPDAKEKSMLLMGQNDPLHGQSLTSEHILRSFWKGYQKIMEL
ncbi:MAG: Rieske 2Fe-2S domain-containing protein [Pseudomonadota bacterium]